MFKMTQAAARQVRTAAEQGGTDAMWLRLAAARKPDGAIDYRMGFDEPTEDDIRINCEGIKVLLTPEQVPLLDQAIMDFVELEPGQFHFIFLNPLDPGYRPPMAE
jgi:iron-sulfur cluster assembly protein